MQMSNSRFLQYFLQNVQIKTIYQWYLAVLPTLWMYVFASSGQSNCSTQFTAGKSRTTNKNTLNVFQLRLSIKLDYLQDMLLY